MSKVLYYLPVDEKYLDQWEYYKVDKEMLKESYKIFMFVAVLYLF